MCVIECISTVNPGFDQAVLRPEPYFNVSMCYLEPMLLYYLADTTWFGLCHILTHQSLLLYILFLLIFFSSSGVHVCEPVCWRRLEHHVRRSITPGCGDLVVDSGVPLGSCRHHSGRRCNNCGASMVGLSCTEDLKTCLLFSFCSLCHH
jgi:hypothetical protein